jgi:hypothetical protein
VIIGATQLADRGACADTNVAFSHRTVRRVGRGAVAAIRSRSNLRVSSEWEIEDDRRRYDRHDAGARLIPDTLFLEVAHHTLGDIEPECAAAGENDRVDLVDHVQRIEQVGFARPGGGAALRNARGRSGSVDDDDGAAGGTLGQCKMPNANSGNVGETLSSTRRWLLRRRVCRDPEDGGGDEIHEPHVRSPLNMYLMVRIRRALSCTTAAVLRRLSTTYSERRPPRRPCLNVRKPTTSNRS